MASTLTGLSLAETFRKIAPAADFCSLRVVDERSEGLWVRQDVLQPVSRSADIGAMITVVADGGMGYAATADLSEDGLRAAAQQALAWARATAGRMVFDPAALPQARAKGRYTTPVARPWADVSLADKIALLRDECARLKVSDRIVDWDASLSYTSSETLYLTADGGEVHQHFHFLVPGMSVTAHCDGETQTRSLYGHGTCRQGGLEVLDACAFTSQAPQLAAEVLELLEAPDCPSGRLDLLLAPDQMILQIHESIGHPLELDRILGDERNYAGTSFVTMDMFGSYRYGSELLNVTYDPTHPHQYVSYAFDDEGLQAERVHVIRDGILERPLGGASSQARAGSAGVANARACSWNRAPIDRMANLNVEPGTSSLDDMIAAVERGVYMKTNTSWSIDDSRNKFQFGCEWAREIVDGRLGRVVRSPGYRGVSAEFWRSLAMVGDASTRDFLGTPNCGKGEPNQMVRVGHASPACLFTGVEVFGGE